MSREKVDYRHNIEQLNRMFPDREMLSYKEVMGVLGIKSKATVSKLLSKHNIVPVSRKISKASLARLMCG